MAIRALLHLVDGEEASRAVERAGLGQASIAWRDVLHDGPVHDVDEGALARMRAAFIAGSGWGSEVAAVDAFSERDLRLRQVLASDAELVIWFGPGVQQQLQRLQVLARVARLAGPDVTVCEARLDGQPGTRSAGALQAAFEQRRVVGTAMLARALDGWLAFTADDAGRLDRLLEGDDAGAPDVDAAIRRWREEFPASRDGLSRTERQVLEALDRGVFRVRDVYVAACHHAEEVAFHADLPFATLLCRLAAGPVPLLSHPDQRPVAMPGPGSGNSVFWNDSLLISRAGRERLAGTGDWMLNAPPRWMGGIALHGPAGWRWDRLANRMRKVAAG